MGETGWAHLVTPKRSRKQAPKQKGRRGGRRGGRGFQLAWISPPINPALLLRTRLGGRQLAGRMARLPKKPGLSTSPGNVCVSSFPHSLGARPGKPRGAPEPYTSAPPLSGGRVSATATLAEGVRLRLQDE